MLRSDRNYSKIILSSFPYIYHKFNEISGTTITDISGNNNTGSVHGTVTLNQPSLLPNSAGDKSALFGNTGNIRYATSFAGTSSFTIECLFKTTALNAGLIWCSNNTADVNTGNWDKSLYIENGKLALFTYPGFNLTLATSSNYNDGKTHIVTATVGSRGQEIWVDNALAASNTYTSSQVYSPSYRHIGYAIWVGNGGYFTGLIDEVSIVHSQITTAQIKLRHANAGF